MKQNTIIDRYFYNNIKLTSINFKERLKVTGFTDKEVKALGFQGQIFDDTAESLHGSSFAHFSSFLYYHDEPIEPIIKSDIVDNSRKIVDSYIPKDWNNINVLQDFDIVGDDKLKAGYVFLGANAGVGAGTGRIGSPIVPFEQFENFQNTGPSKIKKYANSFTSYIDFFIKLQGEIDKGVLQRNHKLRYTKKSGNYLRFEKKKTEEERDLDNDFYLNNISGSYVTDLVKGLPTKNTPTLYNHIATKAREIYPDDDKLRNSLRSKFINLFVDILVDELVLLGGITHTLILINVNDESFVDVALREGRFIEKYESKTEQEIEIVKMNHYSSQATPQYLYRYQLERVFGRNKHRDDVYDWVRYYKNHEDFKNIKIK